jgi:hypothetical protein
MQVTPDGSAQAKAVLASAVAAPLPATSSLLHSARLDSFGGLSASVSIFDSATLDSMLADSLGLDASQESIERDCRGFITARVFDAARVATLKDNLKSITV